MINRSRIRLALAGAIAVTALAMPATTSAVYEYYDNGSTDSYQTTEPMVVCRFENNSGQMDDELDSILVKRLKFVHHPDSSLRKVGVRVILQRNRPPHGDNNFVDYYKFPWVYKMADNNANPKNFGPWTYKVPEDPIALWRARFIIKYYAANGSTVIGEIRGYFEVYRHKTPDSSLPYEIGEDFGDGSVIGYCREEFH
jgi:hypothetical protein